MKGVKTIRKLHMWIGLILSIFLLIEAVTGFILAEPQLVGADNPGRNGIGQHQQFKDSSEIPTADNEPNFDRVRPPGRANNSAIGIAKMLHEGIYGTLSFRWVIAVVGIGLAALTLTGIYLSAVSLRAQNRNRKNKSYPQIDKS